MVYYTGHGRILHGTQRVTLVGTKIYELETKIRNFKNEHSKNAFVWAIFDSCRVVSSVAKESEKVLGEEEQ